VALAAKTTIELFTESSQKELRSLSKNKASVHDEIALFSELNRANFWRSNNG
jgi:hypothetical protein